MGSRYGGIGCTSGDTGRAVNIFGDANIRSGINFMYNYIAHRYASNPNIIFESFNELLAPNNSDGGTPFANFNNGWISAVENGEGNNNHIKIVEVLLNQDSESNIHNTICNWKSYKHNVGFP